MIDDFDNIERSTACAKAALREMGEKSIPASPINYTVWFSHTSGHYPDLSNTLDQMMSSGQPFTRDANQDLFNRFFGTELEADGLRQTGDDLQNKLEEVLKLVAEAGQETGSYSDRLANVQDSLSEKPDANDVERLVQVILAETQKMVDKSQDLENSLKDSAREVQDLRDHLEQVRKESMTDALTGVANRKCFDASLAQAIEDSLQDQEPLSLLMCDIDFFKKFNDTYGHKVGDEVLKLVGRHLKESIKGRDTAARYGGEEFALILPHTDLAGAASLADSLARKLAAKELKNRKTGESFGRVTLSIGAAMYRLGEDIGELVQRADQALYAAKDGGRNRVETEQALRREVSAAG